eukprot:5790613-Prymnesium_polylepis.1
MACESSGGGAYTPAARPHASPALRADAPPRYHGTAVGGLPIIGAPVASYTRHVRVPRPRAG